MGKPRAEEVKNTVGLQKRTNPVKMAEGGEQILTGRCLVPMQSLLDKVSPLVRVSSETVL